MYLNCHSYFSFKYGTLPLEKLIDEAKRFGVGKLVLTDINNACGAFKFVKLCQESGINPVIGIDFRTDGICDFIGIARDNDGFYELNKYLTVRLLDLDKNRNPLDFHKVYLVYPWSNMPQRSLKEHEFIGIRPHETNRLFASPLKEMQHKLVVLHPVTMLNKSEFQLHQVLRAVDRNVVLSKLPPEQQALRNEYFVPIDKLLKCYENYPQIVANTIRLLDDCAFEHDFSSKERKNRKSFLGSRYEDKLHLEKLAFEGMKYRYGDDNAEAIRRIEKELKIIDELDFNAYYLISHDIVSYARRRGFFYVGRGSGANSIVSYCLRITDVDPIELDLYFERFLNIYRSSPPDFDMDFSWKDRDEVNRYIFQRYGEKHVALMANFNTFQGRSIIRELGKVFGLPKSEIDELSDTRKSHRGRDDVSRLIFQYGRHLNDYPKHLSIHAGGVLISEKEIYHYTATEVPPKGFPVTQFDMYIAEDIKFDKFDILSQRGLGHIRSTLDLVHEKRGIDIDIDRVADFKKDPKLNEALAKGDTIGCFYIESPAMRQLLCKLDCDTYPVLVAASSIIRPGVASSGMMREYIKNHRQPHGIRYLHPKMEELLQETYGIMVYQEDVIKVAHHFGGIGMAEADVLRKGMSGKGRSKTQIMKIRDQFFENCIKSGYPHQIILEVWRQIESFAGYSFSKAHSASFAVESYQSLYLRHYYPLEFIVAVINNFGGFYSTEFYVHDAKMLGGSVHAPCVNWSEYLTTLYGNDIYLGFVHLKDLENELGHLITNERMRRGRFRDLEDFLRRVPIGIEQLTLLIRIGAFRFMGKTKKELLWEADRLALRKTVRAGETALFQIPASEFKLPNLDAQPYEDAFDEIELLGFSVCSPFELLDHSLENTITGREMMNFAGRSATMIGYLVTIKDVYTIKKDRMNFGTFIDCNGHLFDTVHFPPSIKKHPFLGKGFYIMDGKIVTDFGVPSLEVDVMKKLPLIKDPRYH
jgi:error-prone DNA polymerase